MSALPHIVHNDRTNAEILLWQARYRTVFAGIMSTAAIVLKATGLVASNALVGIVAPGLNPLAVLAGLVVVYLLFVQLHARVVGRRGSAGTGAVMTVVAADLLIIFTAMFLVTPPPEYSLWLIVAVFALQLTQLYFGWAPALYNLFAIAIGYSALVATATRLGALRDPADALWTLLLFMIGALAYLGLQGARTARLGRLMRVFERGAEGDFSASYDETGDRLPDEITFVGRAWNQMRGNLEQIVLTDPLSGCFNRRGFDQLSQREIARAVRASNEMAVLALDIDHFKRVNDQYGHLTGDEVIREIGGLLRELARAGDVVSRPGGEEFTILATDTGAQGAMHLAERILTAFRSRAFTSVRGQMPITISIGVAAEQARNDEVVKTLIARADEALYAAKRNGRDQSVLWHPGMRTFDAAGRRTGSYPTIN
ncbi:MAG: diguanylate cyclase [Gemmatimonadaceae bacterium]|nr:diguanylate cyclase [Gemmatimonadaceae bacterium]